MANLPPPLNLKAAPFEASSSSVAAAAAANKDRRMQSAEQLVLDLCNPDFRENALLELSKVFRCFSLFLSFRVFHALKRRASGEFLLGLVKYVNLQMF